MKILLVVPDTHLGGGITASVVNFSNELVSRGHTVCLLDMSGKHQCADRLNGAVTTLSLQGISTRWNVRAEDLSSVRGIKKLALLSLGAIKKLTIRSGAWYRLIFSKFNRGEAFDVAVAFRQCDSCYSFVRYKVNAKKKLGFVHGELAHMGDISSWKKHMTSFDKIAYVSSAVKDGFIKAYPELAANACTVYNTFNVEQIKALSAEPCDLAFDQSKVNIVTVARIDNAFKQVHWIVDICERLKQATSTPFHWYVVGDGPDFHETVALSRDRGTDDVLTFVGRKKNPFSYVRQSDFTVLTSKSEAYPMVIPESFILKKPIVVASFPAITEMMEDGKQGLIAEQSVESLTDRVARMIENRDGIRTASEAQLLATETTNDLAYEQFLAAVTQ